MTLALIMISSKFYKIGGEKKSNGDAKMFLPGLEPGTFRVWGGRDNHYTTRTQVLEQYENIGYICCGCSLVNPW